MPRSERASDASTSMGEAKWQEPPRLRRNPPRRDHLCAVLIFPISERWRISPERFRRRSLPHLAFKRDHVQDSADCNEQEMKAEVDRRRRPFSAQDSERRQFLLSKKRKQKSDRVQRQGKKRREDENPEKKRAKNPRARPPPPLPENETRKAPDAVAHRIENNQ